MKIYAKQVSPEYQESPIFIDGLFPDNIAVCGNRDFKEHTTEIFDHVKNVLVQGELAEILEYPDEWKQWYKNVTAAILDYLPPTNKDSYTTKETHALRNLIIDFSCCVCSREDEIICSVLSIVDGRKWDYKPIHGYCQSDWNYIYYPVDEWSENAIKQFETEYFDMGTEWIITDEFDPEEDTLNDLCGASIYCHSCNIDDIRKEIAEAEDVKPEEVVLYEFAGYEKIPKYREVCA